MDAGYDYDEVRELIEEEELLAEFYLRGREFMKERSINVYNWSDDL